MILKKKAWLVGLTAMLLVTLIPATQSFAEDDKVDVITNLLCPLGCGTLQGDSILGTIIGRKEKDLFFRPQETPGYIYNIREMGSNKVRWPNTVFGVDDDDLIFAKWGNKEPFKEFYQVATDAKFQLIYGEGYWLIGHYFITFDPNLKTMGDLKGKKIALGLRTQTNWGMNPRLDLQYGYGITPENTKIFHVGTGKLVDLLVDGKVDAIVGSGAAEPFYKKWLVSGVIRNLEATGRKLYYVGIDPKVLDKLNEKFGTAYFPVTIPAGSFPSQDKPFISGADRGFKAAHISFREDLAYKLVKAIVKYAPEMAPLHGLWKIWSPDLMVSGLTETNTNPGAVKAYKELGIWELRKKYKPIKFWWESE